MNLLLPGLGLDGSTPRPVIRWPAGALAWIACALAAGPALAQPANAYRDAFIAFFPLYEMARLRYLALEEPRNPARVDVNRFNHARRLLDHRARTVTAPNNDTLYSSAWLDLRHGPVTVAIPAMPGRYRSLQFMNAHTDNVAIVGRRNAGDGPLTVAIVGPGWSGPVPPHTHRVDSDTFEMWLLVRLLVDGPGDLAAVGALQDAMRVEAPRPASEYPKPVSLPKESGPEQFVDGVDAALRRNPANGAMAAHALAARTLGITGDDAGGWARLPGAVRDGWTAAWPALKPALMAERNPAANAVGGWRYPPRDVGRWGTNLALRAVVALQGIAALDVDEVLYLNTMDDAHGRPLDGGASYRLRIPPGGLPVDAFWSITMYEVQPDGRYFFTPNPIDRFSIGNRTRGLKTNPDRSIDVLMQHATPADATNWLPAPAGRFRLSLRNYLPAPALVEGRVPLPRIERLP
ncbi:MAG: DUF1254 domain-containing protein [Burkholderiaceae bacterium]